MAERTRQMVDIKSSVEETLDKDGNTRLWFPVLEVEAVAGTPEEARELFMERFHAKLEDETTATQFQEWAADHMITVDVPEEEYQEQVKLEEAAHDAGKEFRELTPDTFDAAIASSKPVLVDFWAPWCRPCLFAAPVLKEIHDELTDVFDVVKVNTEDHHELGERYDVQGIPCFVLFKDGAEIDRIIGFAPKAEFRAEIDRVLAKV